MYDRYTDREKYFREQSYTTERYVIPYISEILPLTPGLVVAEIGCGEGGNLKPILDIGCKVVGIDLAENKISNALKFFDDHPKRSNLTLIPKDIYNILPEDVQPFDLIMMRDTFEHIHDQDCFMQHLKGFLKTSGRIFIGFPPWRMPFGGHQQMCENNFLNRLPYFHLLPKLLYKIVLKLFGESEAKISGLMEIRETRISISGFKRLIKKSNFKIDRETFYLVNPNYEIKFSSKPRILPDLLNIPFLKEFFITTYYCIISIKRI